MLHCSPTNVWELVCLGHIVVDDLVNLSRNHLESNFVYWRYGRRNMCLDANKSCFPRPGALHATVAHLQRDHMKIDSIQASSIPRHRDGTLTSGDRFLSEAILKLNLCFSYCLSHIDYHEVKT